MADKMIVALVKVWEKAPAELSEPGWGLDIWDLAATASMISEEEARQRRKRFFFGAMDNLPSVQALMKHRGWVMYSDQGEFGKHSTALFPTLEGIDYAHKKMRSWPIKTWRSVGKPIIRIIVALISKI